MPGEFPGRGRVLAATKHCPREPELSFFFLGLATESFVRVDEFAVGDLHKMEQEFSHICHDVGSFT